MEDPIFQRFEKFHYFSCIPPRIETIRSKQFTFSKVNKLADVAWSRAANTW